MKKYVVVTGASKGVGRAPADALAGQGWLVIGVERTQPVDFPGKFIEADLADQGKTEIPANDLAAHGEVLGTANNVGCVPCRRYGRVHYRPKAVRQ